MAYFSLNDKTSRPPIMFRARQLEDLSPSQNQKRVFQTNLDNQGGGYNKDTGVFTAPHDGEYLFTVQLCLSDTKEFVFKFVQDGVEKQTAEFQNGAYGCITSI